MEFKLFLRHSKPYLAVIFIQFGRAGIAIIAKYALNRGMSHFTFAVYRNIVATLVFAPLALFFERKIRPKMTISILWKIALLGLLGPVIDQNLTYAGMQYTTATFSAALGNILPVLTFLLAWLFRLEKVSIRRLHGQAKIFGTLVSVGGAMVMTLVTGPVIGFPWTKHGGKAESGNVNDEQDPIKGALMITAACLCWASSYILQAITLKTYPAGLSLTTLICFVGAIQGTILTFIVERGNTTIWSIHWDSKLLASVYSGIISSGATYYISGVIMKERGPVFVTAFSPLTMVVVAALGSVILSEHLHFGRILGACIIVVGLYIFIWGKSKDKKLSSSNCDQITPIDQQIPITDSKPKISDKDHIEVCSKINGESLKKQDNI